MLHQLLNRLNQRVAIPEAQAHCDIPCKIYDPISAQLAALSVIRFLDLINELQQKESLTITEQGQLIRLINEKEIHAAKVKEEVRVIWGDFFKAPQLAELPDTHELAHSIMLAASACKQNTDREKGEALLELVNKFASYFWQAKGVATYTATCPYPPEETVIYPQLNK